MLDPLYQHATDFMRLVDINTLAPSLIQSNLLTSRDREFLQLQAITHSKSP